MAAETDKYDVLEKIGHGSFGIIRKVRRKGDGMILCRKEISYLKMSQKEREQLHAEFHILSTLRHPHIVGYYHREHLKTTQDLHLYMEYCGNGDLGRTIRDLQAKNKYAEESFVWSIFSQLVTALFRCHYGVDPPEVGKDVLGLGPTAKPKAPTGGMTILHRDLKPENVFLGEDNSVKLGDFGLSKLIQSHDFASTYVGTPFYMSPEICAAEKYTLKSDIWSLGCIIYELCTREPPFNAKSHYQLVQKIKEGKVAPLPSCYSPELMAVIKDCLRVNPDRRPDTASLLNLPVVRLMRKEKEVVECSRMLRTKEQVLVRREREYEQKRETDRIQMRNEIEASVRREWEVKARLEIDRLAAIEVEELRRKFEVEVKERVEQEIQIRLQKRKVIFSTGLPQEFGSSAPRSDYQESSLGASSIDGDFLSTTDITDMSSASPVSPDAPKMEAKRPARTPFARAQTFAVGAGTPGDVDMADPSPMVPNIESLALSPRRRLLSKAPHFQQGNIFRPGSGEGFGSKDPEDYVSSDDSDDEAIMPSPTRNVKSNKNPFDPKSRPKLSHRSTETLHRMKCQPVLPQSAKTTGALPIMASSQDLRQKGSNAALRERAGGSPNRLSKIPSAANLKAGSEGDTSAPDPVRKTSRSLESKPSSGGLVSKKGSGIKGRTLVELQQLRAGGRAQPAVPAYGAENNTSPRRAFRDHATGRRSPFSEPAIWDPECDEMPSPFLIRRKPKNQF